MRRRHFLIILAGVFNPVFILPGSRGEDLKPYPLPPAARARIEKLAAGSDVLILGEVHGTREVPEIVAGLLGPLTELGYHALAVEVPSNHQASLTAWARGETDTVPEFFANPNEDGIGNVQLLTLARVAASPPYRWTIVCFDEPESPLDDQAGQPGARKLTDDEIDAYWRKRDATMASHLIKEAGSPGTTKPRVLAICGNLHARTTNDTRDATLSRLWPSFARVLTQTQPAWRVSSVNIEFFGGAYFNGGKVQTFPKRPLEQAEVRPAGRTGYDLLLCVPVARPATLRGNPAGGSAGPAR